MPEEINALGLLILTGLVGMWIFLSSLNTIGILLILIGAIVFFGLMVVAGENSDFDDIHSEW